MAGTRILQVRQGLTNALAALPAFANTDVGMLWRDGLREQVFTTEAEFTHEPASLKAGRTFRNETGRFDLVVLVVGVGDDAATVAARAVTLGTVAEEWIADNRTAQLPSGTTGLNWIVVKGDGALTEAFSDRGSIAELRYRVEYSARLT